MRRKTIKAVTALTLALALVATIQPGVAQTAPKPRSTIAQSLTPPAFPLSRVQDSLIEFPLPKGEEAYRSIDGKKMHKYVVDLAEISRRYRDAGHPKYWGRIMGTSSDRETEDWLAARFKAAGLSDVRIQPIALPPQWTPTAWDVTMTSGRQTIQFGSSE